MVSVVLAVKAHYSTLHGESPCSSVTYAFESASICDPAAC